jgi:hypothetical protein
LTASNPDDIPKVAVRKFPAGSGSPSADTRRSAVNKDEVVGISYRLDDITSAIDAHKVAHDTHDTNLMEAETRLVELVHGSSQKTTSDVEGELENLTTEMKDLLEQVARVKVDVLMIKSNLPAGISLAACESPPRKQKDVGQGGRSVSVTRVTLLRGWHFAAD